MADPVIRGAGPGDGPALAALRRAWTEEQHGPLADPGFEDRFAAWYARESGHRLSWLAAVDGALAGMVNLSVFDRMPQPGRDAGRWGYLGNAFVLAAYRNQGVGAALLGALLAHADEQRYVKVVLSPSERSVPFYLRHGFTADSGLLVRPLP